MKGLQKVTWRGGRRTVSAVLGAAALVLAGGTAYAYWGTSGTGSGSAAAGQLQTLATQALVQAAPGQQPLSPGGTADAVVRVSNPNPYDVQLFSVVSAGAATADASHPQCVTTGVSFQNQNPLAQPVTIPANATQTVTIPSSVSMGLTSDAGCQGAHFNLPLTLEVRK
ncbi:hypothetical protein [Sinomonas sp.]|jgi:hypothetical protein|uniref:hypothetical protein n=1 Tax=Sinomonas sp. TaxID=1914986 RepID=UPI003F7D484F